MKESWYRSPFIWLSTVLIFTALACGLGANGTSTDQQATVQALGTSVSGTTTAEAVPSSVGLEDVQQAQITATQKAQEIKATQDSQTQLDTQAQTATAAAFSPVIAQLPFFGIDPPQGSPGWLHPPLRLELDAFHDYDYGNEFLTTIAADFVVSADITWDTQYGGSGCGFVLRSNGKQDAFDQYVVIATRGASGHVLFGVMSGGKLVGGQDFYAYGRDPDFDWHNGTTNQLTVVARGDQFAIFTNSTHIGDADPTAPLPALVLPDPPPKPADMTDPRVVAAYTRARAEYETVVAKIKADYAARLKTANQAPKEFDKGFVAMVALSESGHTVCQFQNAWLWLLD